MLLACPNCTTTYEVLAVALGDNGRPLRCARCQHIWFATPADEIIAVTPPAEPAVSPDAPAPTETAPAGVQQDAIDPPISPELLAVAQELARVDQTVTATPAEIPTHTIEAPLSPDAPGAGPGAATLVGTGEDIETFARRHAEKKASRAQRLRAQFGPPAVILTLVLLIAALISWRESIVRHAPQLASFYGSIGMPVNLRGLVFSNVKTDKEASEGVPVLLVEGTITSVSKNSVEVPRLRFALRNDSGQEIFSWTAKPENSTLAPGESLPFRSRLASPPSGGRDVVVRFFNGKDATEGPR